MVVEQEKRKENELGDNRNLFDIKTAARFFFFCCCALF